MQPSPPVVLTIAGSDCSGGAGIQADLKTISALGGYGLSAVTAVVSETPGKVSQIQLMEPTIVADQIRVLLEGFPIAAAKVGMVGGRAQVEAVVEAWQAGSNGRIPLVVDPVMVATSGGRLLEDDAVAAVVSQLLPLARVITPNMDEATVLWDRKVKTRADMEQCAADLASRFGVAVLVKGGHLEGDAAADVLCDRQRISWHEAPRTPGVHTHGTGCTYSAAIASGLAKGLSLRDAVRKAKLFVSRAVAQFFEWRSPDGAMLHALNHLHQHS